MRSRRKWLEAVRKGIRDSLSIGSYSFSVQSSSPLCAICHLETLDYSKAKKLLILFFTALPHINYGYWEQVQIISSLNRMSQVYNVLRVFAKFHLAGNFTVCAAGGWELWWYATGREGAKVDVSSEYPELTKVQEKLFWVWTGVCHLGNPGLSNQPKYL